MRSIELTPVQGQALRAEEGKPVAVVDPATQQCYMLLAREQYELVRSLLEGKPQQATSSESSPAAAAREGKPLRQCLRDLPLPAAVAAEADRYCRRLGLWRAKNRRQMEEQISCSTTTAECGSRICTPTRGL